MEEAPNPAAEKRKEENKKANAEVTKLVQSIVGQPPKPAVVVTAISPDEVKKLEEDLAKQPGTIRLVPNYENEISAIGVILRNLADLSHEQRQRVLNYAMEWADQNAKYQNGAPKE